MASFLNERIASEIRSEFGSPVYVYDESTLLAQANATLQFPVNSGGLTVRYAMKACPNAAILQVIYLSLYLSHDDDINYSHFYKSCCDHSLIRSLIVQGCILTHRADSKL